MSQAKPFQNVPFPLRLTGRFAQCLVLLAFIPALLLAYRSSATSNIFFVFLMVAIVVVIVSRAFALANGNLIWRFWTASKTSIFGSFSRLLFYIGIALVSYFGGVHRAFGAANEVWMVAFPILSCSLLALLSLPPRRFVNWPVTTFCAVLAPFLIGIVLFGLRTPAGETFTVAYPLDRPSMVMHGGPSLLTNYHYIHQSQKFAVDIGGSAENGMIMKPGDPLSKDGCFGAGLLAVADGEVVKVVSDEVDVPIGQRSKGHPAGNHILLEIAPSRYALYAHLKQNSAAVEEGQRVKTGEIIGACGNSGNTSQPHLHFQIQSHLDLFDSENQTFPVQFTGVERQRFSGRKRMVVMSPLRNDVIYPVDP